MNEEIHIFNSLIQLICSEIKLPLSKIEDYHKENIEEIRLRINAPLSIFTKGQDYFVSLDGKLSTSPKESIIIGVDHINKTFQLIANYSIYALTEEIRNGFITIKGGHRVGIGGKIIYGNRGIENIKNISSLNIRIGRQKVGISENIIPFLIDSKGYFYNTLIISPPQCGKTTLLRDIIRNLSNGNPDLNRRGYKIGLVDERSEIAGVYNGIPQKDVGIRTDILDSCLKSDGIMILIRAMSPEIIAVDEIGTIDDCLAIEESLRAGVKLIATVHGFSLEDVKMKKSLRRLFDERVFKRFIVLDNSKGVGTIREIIDGDTLLDLKQEKRRFYVNY